MAGSPITQSGSTYSLSASFSGLIVDERNGSTLNGGGFALNASPSGEAAVSVLDAENVTVEDLTVNAGTGDAFEVDYSAAIVLTSDAVNGTGYAVDAQQVSGLTVTDDQFGASDGIYEDSGSALLVAHDNLTRTDGGVDVTDVGGVWIEENNLSYGTGEEVEVEEASDVVVSSNALYNDAGYDTEQIYLYEVAGATVTWNNATYGDYGVDLEDSSDGWIADNRLTNTTDTAVYLEYTTGVTVQDNDLAGAGDEALYGYYVTDLSFTNNVATHSGDEAVYLEYVTNSLLSHNNLSYFAYDGVEIEDSGNATITYNQASYATSSDSYGFYTEYCADVVLSWNNATWDSYGWYDEESTGVTVVGDDFSYAEVLEEDPVTAVTPFEGYAIYLEYDGGITISDVAASHNEYGLYGEDVDGLWVSDTQFDDSSDSGVYAYDLTDATFTDVGANDSVDDGVYIEDSTGLTLTDVWATPSADYGFDLYYDQGVTMTGCDAASSGYGVYAEDLTTFVLASTNLSKDNYGLYLYETAAAVIEGNVFWNDNDSFDYEYGNAGVLYHNNFLGDKAWVIDATDTAAFQWDNGYPSGGNYWSNYTGMDTKSGPGQNLPGSDGIGDTPFALNATTADEYPLMTPWVAHTITFTETGLSAGTTWSVSVGGVTSSSSSNAVIVWENDGATSAYSYSVLPVAGYHANPSSGTGTEAHSNLAVAIVFTPVNYTVTFSAAGIPSSGTWAIDVDGTTLTGTGPTLTVPEANGSFSYRVGPGSDYTFAPGTFTVAGAPVTVTLAVTELLYNITITESGLSSGTSWSVTLNGVTKTSSGATIVFQEPNGTYTYTVGSVAGHSLTPSKGQTSVTGGAVALGVAYGSSSSGGLTATDWGLLAGLIIALLLAILGWIMYLRRRKPSPPGPMSPAYMPPDPPSPPPPSP